MRKSKIHPRLFVLVVLLCMFAAQRQETILTATSLTNSHSSEPVEVSIGIDKTKPPEKLGDDNSWLDHLVVQAKNTSGKTVRYLEVKILLPNTKSEVRKLSLPFIYGHPYSKSKEMEPVKTGVKVNLRATRSRCEEAKKQLARLGHSPFSINELKTSVNLVIFDDGTAWYFGQLHRQDPNDPMRWLVTQQPSNDLVLKPGAFNQAINKVAYKPASSLIPVKQSVCGRMNGFTIDFCCTDGGGADYYIGSPTIVSDPNGNIQAVPATECCPQNPGSCCEYLEIAPCSQ
jgi:hypothetical protein